MASLVFPFSELTLEKTRIQETFETDQTSLKNILRTKLMNTFEALGLPKSILAKLSNKQFLTPTPIQAEAIPHALAGKDILGSAQTGTGKTLAFGIPLITHLVESRQSRALVMTPTRELAAQVLKEIHSILPKEERISTALLIGGEAMPKQFRQLDKSPRIIVGTPGRINDHLRRRSLNLEHTDFLVLDETDRMLDMGFLEQIEDILKITAKNRQTLLFSATLPKNIVRISESYLNSPVRVAIKGEKITASNISEKVMHVTDGEKYSKLVDQLDVDSGPTIIFVKTKRSADKMAERLSKTGRVANALHGDLRQSKRDRLVEQFRKKRYRILVATDVASRGLDIKHIEHVINYDLPQVPEDYVHRIGRTARAGAEGSALSLVTPADKRKWAAISRLVNPQAEKTKEDGKPKGNRRRPRNRRARNRNGSQFLLAA